MRKCSIPFAILLTIATAGASSGTDFATPEGNFVVSAKDPSVARQIGEYAEYYRRSKAVEWLGNEMPRWNQPCSIEVRLTYGGAGGATSFAFDQGQILSQSMVVEGSLDRIIDSVLPHEITHTVFAHKFRRPLPRWADEGGAVLSEDYQELRRHDLLVRQLINSGRMIPLGRLFVLTEYPRDVMALYAQGFSVANFLVSRHSRSYFLDFVDNGQRYGWQRAVYQFYGYSSVDQLESAWIEWLRVGRGTGADLAPELANQRPVLPTRNGASSGIAAASGREWNAPSRSGNSFENSGRVVRGQMPDEEDYAANSMRNPQAPRGTIVDVNPMQPTFSGRSAVSSPREPADFPSNPFSNATAASRQGIGQPRTLDDAAFTAKPSSESREPQGDTLLAAPPRIIPIAVGRTRRSHSSD